MPQTIERREKSPGGGLPPLQNGDCLDQTTFHERYLAMAPDFRAELVEGVVYVSSPLKMNHSRHHGLVMAWLGAYWAATPGTLLGDNPTVILGEQSEPQPDAVLMIGGGQAQISEDDFIEGAPELIVEVAFSSEAYDMHQKRRDYERAGVQEYIVVLLREELVRYLALDEGAYRDVASQDDGVFRSRIFPGLWLDGGALLRLEGRRVLDVLHEGLSEAAHAAFVERLSER